MITRLCFIGMCLALAGCGVDGAPVRPSVTAGIGLSQDGISTHGAAQLRKGPLAVILGF